MKRRNDKTRNTSNIYKVFKLSSLHKDNRARAYIRSRACLFKIKFIDIHLIYVRRMISVHFMRWEDGKV